MSTSLDFNSTKEFRNFILSKTLNVQNGPQSFTVDNYQVNTLNTYSNVEQGDVDKNRVNDLLNHQKVNTYKPLVYTVKDSFDVIPRLANLNLYPYFETTQDHTLVSIFSSEKYEMESELFKFASQYIKSDKNGPIQSRIKQNILLSSGKEQLLDSIKSSSYDLSNIINGQEPFNEVNNRITVLNDNYIDFMDMVDGTVKPRSIIPGEYLTNPENVIYNAVNSIVDSIGNTIGINNISSVIKPSEILIEYMGSGQKNALFKNLSYSLYSPNYNNFSSTSGIITTLQSPYIGDDITNNVKYTMSDGNDRIVKSNFYLSLMFDETAARLFEKRKNISEGGGIAGKLTWISKKSKNQKGLYNSEFNSESSEYNNTLSSEYSFRDGSILGVTQELLNSMPTDSSSRSHVSNAIDQTSRVFKEGDQMLSKGSAIKFVDKFSQEESGVEYCRVWTKDRSYMNYSDTMKKTGLIRKYNSSVMSNPWNLNIHPVSNGNKSFDGSTNIESYGGGFRAKKYMFSIENLAWKTSNKPEFTYEDLPYCERGPNGGRIMWFPPYGVKISEQNGAKWEENSFIGRPEPIFTYQQTTRSANLEFKILVDHPSILNLLVRDLFKNMSNEESENYINAFFAGCEELDFYDLIKRYSSLDATDVEMIRSYLNDGKDSQLVKTYRTNVEPVGELRPTVNSVEYKTFDSTLYYPNDSPSISSSGTLYSDTPYGDIFKIYTGSSENYITKLNKGLDNIKNNVWSGSTKNDYKILTKIDTPIKPETNVIDSVINNVNNEIVSGFIEISTEYKNLLNGLNDLKKQIIDKKVKKVILAVESSASATASGNYNLKLSYRRSYSVIKEIMTKLSLDGNITNVMSKVKWKYNDKDIKSVKKIEFSEDKNKILIKFNELGYKDNDGLILINTVLNSGEDLDNVIINGKKNVTCNDKTLFKDTNLGSTAPTAFWCRESYVKIGYELNNEIKGENPTTKITIEEINEPKQTKPNIDVLKKIVMKVLGECYYFKKLEEESPLQFSSLKEKLKYFHPAFHSMTPEGLNSRLSFLHQCIRPGDTIPVKGVSDENDLNARNTSFGPPPVVVFRFGDFYNTKAIIRDYNISFDESLWDLNPEGIGIQPMIASVTLQLSLIGGQGMEAPVNELQNALSSNFYANTEVYDYRSTATEDRTKFNKETLEEILNYQTNVVSTKANDNSGVSKVSQGSFIGTYNSSTNIIDYVPLIKKVFNDSNDYITRYSSAYNNILKKYGKVVSSLILSEKYRTINNYVIQTGADNLTIKLLGDYKEGSDLSTILTNLNLKIQSLIESSNISSIFDFDMNTSVNKESEKIIKPFLKEKIKNGIFEISNSEYKSVEEKRNILIQTLDKLNFMCEVEYDGYISSDVDQTYIGKSISGFTGVLLYDQCSKAINDINDNYNNFQKDLDDSLDFISLSLTDDMLIELICVFLTDDDIKSLIGLYTNRDKTLFSTKIINSIDKKIRKVYNKISVDSKLKLVGSQFNEKVTFSFNVVDDYVFSDDEKINLYKVNLTTRNKTIESLNFYRP